MTYFSPNFVLPVKQMTFNEKEDWWECPLFGVEDKPVIVVMAGDGRVNSSKFKALFHTKPSMIPRDRVEEVIGFLPGGVCPFGVDKSIPIWLDISMKRFEYIHPAGGNEFVSVKLTPDELEKASDAVGWCDVCKGWEE